MNDEWRKVSEELFFCWEFQLSLKMWSFCGWIFCKMTKKVSKNAIKLDSCCNYGSRVAVKFYHIFADFLQHFLDESYMSKKLRAFFWESNKLKLCFLRQYLHCFWNTNKLSITHLMWCDWHFSYQPCWTFSWKFDKAHKALQNEKQENHLLWFHS